jgi:hypothetical protein
MTRSLLLFALFVVALIAVGCEDSLVPNPVLTKQVPTPRATTTQLTNTAIPTPVAQDTITQPIKVAPPTPSASSTPLPLSMWIVTALSFSDAAHGWAYGIAGRGWSGPIEYALRVTNDGGQTWSPVFSPSGQEQAWTYGRNSSGEPYQIYLANTNDGWIFNPGFLSTHDGGKTWTDESSKIDVVAIGAVGDTVWRIEHTCCSLHLSISSNNGHTWNEPPTQPALPNTSAQLMRTSKSDAWILALSSDYPQDVSTPLTKENQYAGILFVTHNAGRTWEQYGAPDGEFDKMVAIPDGTLWNLLSSVPSAGNQLKTVYKSVDGGQTWSEVAKSTPYDGLPDNGYTDGGFAAASGQATWILTDDPGQLLQSTNGGYTWSSIHMAVPLGEGNENYGLMSLDSEHVWFASDNKVFRTTDGGVSWSGGLVP